MLYRIGREFFGRHPRRMTGALGGLARWVPQGIRYGADFRHYRRLLDESQWWSRERLERYQLEKLRETVQYAYRYVPFYRDLYDRLALSPDDLRSLDDIRRFPIIDKETLRENYDRVLASHFSGQRLMTYCTGGTTGSGVILLFEEAFRQREQAFIWRLWNEVGYRPRSLAAVLQHRECPPEVNDGIWYMDRPSNALILSAHRLSRETAAAYFEALDRHRPRVLIAYPSLAHLLAGYGRELGRSHHPFDLVLCGSETLYDFQRRNLEDFFRAPVRIHYGHIESCALFGYCRESNVYHVQPEYGFVEFLGEGDRSVEAGEVGEIVATGFDNRTMPLIRFRTRDFAEPAAGTCDACGRPFPLVRKIQGRQADYIRTPSGRSHSPTVIEVLMDKMLLDGYSGFADLQIVQDAIDEVAVQVIPGKTFSLEELDRFCATLSDALDGEVRVERRIVPEIPRSPRQKKSLIVSNLREGAEA